MFDWIHVVCRYINVIRWIEKFLRTFRLVETFLLLFFFWIVNWRKFRQIAIERLVLFTHFKLLLRMKIFSSFKWKRKERLRHEINHNRRISVEIFSMKNWNLNVQLSSINFIRYLKHHQLCHSSFLPWKDSFILTIFLRKTPWKILNFNTGNSLSSIKLKLKIFPRILTEQIPEFDDKNKERWRKLVKLFHSLFVVLQQLSSSCWIKVENSTMLIFKHPGGKSCKKSILSSFLYSFHSKKYIKLKLSFELVQSIYKINWKISSWHFHDKKNLYLSFHNFHIAWYAMLNVVWKVFNNLKSFSSVVFVILFFRKRQSFSSFCNDSSPFFFFKKIFMLLMFISLSPFILFDETVSWVKKYQV